MIDFLARDPLVATRPWQGFDSVPVTLVTGWYVLRVRGEAAAVCLQLRDPATFTLVELSATQDRPAYIRLMAGTWLPRLYIGARPGRGRLTALVLEPLSESARLQLMAGRTVEALKGGVSPQRLAGLAAKVLKPRGTFGIRAAGGDQGGALSEADKLRAWQAPADLPERLRRLEDGPRLRIRATGGGVLPDMSTQVYSNWTLDAGPDWTVMVQSEERLTPDALLLFAEAIARSPDMRVIVGDRWEAGLLNLRVAFDPLFYGDGPPTPIAVQRDVSGLAALSWAQQQPRFAALGVAVAAVDTAPPAAGRTPLPAPAGRASVIIPTRDKAGLLRVCLDSLARQAWPHEVILIDNGSVDENALAVLDEARSHGATVIRDDGPFNFSRLSNLGAAAAKGDWLVFMNNDIELLDEALTPLVAVAGLPDVGAAGGRLLYDDRRLQHGGVALGLSELCGHMWRGLSWEDQQKEPRLAHTSLRSAVTGALLCVARAKFEAIGGFDEAAFPVTLNDIDLCLRLRRRGWYSVYCAEACAFHHEGATRGDDHDSPKAIRRRGELAAFAARWGAEDCDPWLPSAVSRSGEALNLK